MTNQTSRTSEEEIRQLTYFYRFFRPNELAFVLDLNKKWSRDDANKYETISKVLRESFRSDQSANDVRALIEFSLSHPWIFFSNEKPLENILRQEYANVHLSPFITTCPVCNKQLGPNEAETKHVTIYTLSAEIQKGILIRNQSVFTNSLSKNRNGVHFEMFT